MVGVSSGFGQGDSQGVELEESEDSGYGASWKGEEEFMRFLG